MRPLPAALASSLASALAGTALLAASLSAAAPGRAQYSPNCRFNGRPAACAITPLTTDDNGRLIVVAVVFADHSAYRLERPREGCRQEGTVTTCPATVIPDNGNGRPRSGTYRGTWYEGGYRHEYQAHGVHITYSFLD